ncbi:MAG: 3-hydroxyacyl-CoA dehydrogenase [Sandaracinaceae bacterium]|nr:3-hydroxyacyl-CoA dehydrogenase [Sandaracinaceae bacterium]
MKLEGISALITGGGSGLGEATARALAEAGVKVVILDRDADRAKKVADEIGGAASPGDVTDPASVQAAIDAAKALGPLRIAVNCAGIGVGEKTVGRENVPHDLDSFRKVIEVNLIGSFNVMRLAAAAMAETESVDGERGVIVNTASVAAFDGQIGQVAYSASKGGLVGLTLPAARDLASLHIRVVTIAPGIFDTPLLGSLPDNVRDALGKMVPHPARLGQPHEYGALVRHIAENAYLNGEVIRLDGAIRMQPR